MFWTLVLRLSLFYSEEGLTSETSVSFLFLYGVEFTSLSLNLFQTVAVSFLVLFLLIPIWASVCVVSKSQVRAPT